MRLFRVPVSNGFITRFITRFITQRAIILTAVMASACAAELDEGCPALQVGNIGHRGTGNTSSGNPFPENTIESFLQAATEGAQMVELDVTHSADGVLVVIHDARVDRTTDGSGCVAEMSLSDLQSLDAGFGTAMEGTGVVIPTLAQVLDAVDVDINIEVKIHDSCPTIDVPRVAQDIASAIASDTKERRIIVSSFDAEMLVAVQNVDPSIYLGLLTILLDDAEVAAAAGFSSLNVISFILSDVEEVRRIQDMGLDVIVWTENEPANMADFMTWGVDMIITDEPDLLETARSEWCERAGY
ncbi:MAG: glycerophosphoryl diester phosphodiesterase [Polyangiales bacterium]|jgi:glycerophosphoryl diester phosphodiesterase